MESRAITVEPAEPVSSTQCKHRPSFHLEVIIVLTTGRNLTQQHQEAGIDRQVRNGILDVQHKRFEWIPIGKQKQLWSKINSHVVVVGDKFGSKELYEVSCPRGTDFGRLASLMR